MPNGIAELLKKYGTSLEETRKLMPELVESIERERAMRPPALPAVPRFFTAEEVSGMGLVTEAGEPFELELGWRLKVAPPVDGQEPAISYITPEDWEITQDQIYISPEGKRFTREELEAQVVAPEVPLEVEQVFGRVFPERDVVEVLAYAEAQPEAFYADIMAIGRTEETETFLKTIFPEITPEQIEELFAPVAERAVPTREEFWAAYPGEPYPYEEGVVTPVVPITEPTLPPIPPEGITYMVEDKEGKPLELHILEDFEYVGTERRLVSPDYIVYHEKTQIGKFIRETGEFVPTELEWWQKVLGIGAKTLEYAFLPFAIVGQMTRDWWEKLKATAPWLSAEEREKRIKELEADVARRAKEEGLKQILPGGSKYEEFKDLPWYQQLLFELPAWIAIGAMGLSAIKGRAALAPLAARPGLPGVVPTITKGVLYPLAKVEQAVAYSLQFILNKPAQALANRSIARNFHKYLVAQGIKVSPSMEKTLLNAFRTIPAPRASALFQKQIRASLVAQYGERAVGEYFMNGYRLTPDVIRQVITFAQAKGNKSLVRLAQNFLRQVERSGRAEAGVELLHEKFAVDFFKAFEVAGGKLTSETGYEIGRIALTEAQKFYPMLYQTGVALEGANRMTHTLVMETIVPSVMQVTPGAITAEMIASLIPAGVTLSLTKGLIAQLKELGHTEEAISAMKAEEAWANLFKAPALEVAPPTVPPEVPAVEVPAVPEMKLYRTTRGFEEDAALRADLETKQGYKFHAAFETPASAQTAAGKLIGQDIRFVKHISTTGVETWEVYAKPLAVPEVKEVVSPAVSKQIALTHNTTGGASFDIKGKNLVGMDAFAVGVHTDRATFLPREKITEADISEFVSKNADLLSQPEYVIGTWFDKETGNSVLVVSTLRPDIESAMDLARAEGQKEVFNLKTQERIPIPIVSKFAEIKAIEFDAAVAEAPKQEFLTRYSVEELNRFRLFLSEDKLVGFAIKPDGDLINVFNASGVEGAGQEAIVQALVQGATKLDAMGVGFLREYYEDAGFKVVRREAWNEEYAPKGWDYKKYGRPDIIYMEYPKEGSRNAADIRTMFTAARVRHLAAFRRGKVPPAPPVTEIGRPGRRAVPLPVQKPPKGRVRAPAKPVVAPEVVEAPPAKVVPTPEEISKTRQAIMSWVRQKGLSQKQFRDIFMEKGEHRQLHLMTPEQLESVLAEVKVARPTRVKGRRVVTRKTEKKIQTLKDTLIRNKQLTEKSFDRIVEQLNLPTTQYETATKFITETEAKTLIRAMNDEAVLAQWDIKVEEALDRHPDIKTARDAANARSITTKEVTFDGQPIRIRRGNELRSMRYYVLKLQKELNAPIYDVWQKINMTHLAMRQRQTLLYQRLEDTSPEARQIMEDEVTARRVEDYIAAKHKMEKIKSPPDITANEITIANELERQLFSFRNDVRYARFIEAYAGHGGDTARIKLDIPDAPGRALRRAIDVFEGKGATALRTFLDTQEWGVIRTGYDPRSIIKPRLHLYPSRATTFAKGHIQTRRGTEYTTEDRSIFQRYRSYTKQMMGLTDLSPLIRAFDRVFTEHAPKLAPETMRETSKVLSRGLNEMKGYREDGGFIIHAMERLYAQVASAVFWRPDLVLRNKFQNWAFNPDYHAGLFLYTRPGLRADEALDPQRRLWFEIFVSQQKGMREDYLLYLQKPLAIPGIPTLTKWARKTSLYPWSDKSNRAECFLVRISRVDRALARYEKDGNVDRLIKNSGLVDFEARQQAEALELLAMDEVDYGIEGVTPVTGAEAFARYNAQQLTNNVHFLYDRAQRAPAEMGAAGKTLGNILVFSRSWGERLVLQANKLRDPKATGAEKLYALRIIVGIVVAGLLAGATYKKITGKTYNPYNPLNILTWTPGGLILGVTEDISNVIYWMTQAAQGDEKALGRLPGLISGAATMTLPFYKNAVQALDALTDMKDVDVYAMRKIREMVDDEYEVRGGVHEVERTLIEKLQHALLAGKDLPETPQEKVAEAEELLGQTIEEDLPYTIEEPDIFGMKNLNPVMSRNLKDIPLEDITEANDYSELARAWKIKENNKAVYDRLPNSTLYKIEDFEELYAQWREVKDLPDWEKDYPNANLGNFTKRQLEALREYHRLEGAEQAEFLEKHPGLKLNPANEWLKAHPKENAMLALWGQAKILSTEAYDEFNRLVKELDIPDDAIPELTLPPEGSVENYFKYLEQGEELGYNSWEVQLLLAQDDELRTFLERQPIDMPVESLELKVKHRDLFEEYDLLETDEERKALKEANPEWVDDTRRIEAYENEAPEDIVEKWVDRGNTVDEFSAGSSEAKVWLLDNPEVHKWALDQELLTDDGSDWNEPVLRINVKWRELDDQYVGFGDKESEFYIEDDDARAVARGKLLENEAYRKDRRRRDAYGDEFSEDQIENYVAYYELSTKGYRQERMLVENPEFGKAMHEIAGIDLPDPKKVPAVGYDETYEKWQADFEKLEGMADHESEFYIENVNQRAAAREAMRYDARGNPTEFGKAEKRLDAYALFVPEDLIPTFVEWYTSPELKRPDDWEYDYWFEDDWFLMEHPRFYETMLDLKIWLEPTDFSTVPTREVFNLYKTYVGIPKGAPQLNYRARFPELDAWGVLKFGWTPIGQRGKKEKPKTPWERFEEAKRFKELF